MEFKQQVYITGNNHSNDSVLPGTYLDCHNISTLFVILQLLHERDSLAFATKVFTHCSVSAKSVR